MKSLHEQYGRFAPNALQVEIRKAFQKLPPRFVRLNYGNCDELIDTVTNRKILVPLHAAKSVYEALSIFCS
jgi:hypothetical protein